MSNNKKFDKAKKDWKNSLGKSPIREYNFDTLSGKKLDPLYYPNSPSENYLKN